MVWQVLTIGGVLLGAVGLVIAILLLRHRLHISVSTRTLASMPVDVHDHGLRFVYRGDEIPSVSQSEIRIWNAGLTAVKLKELARPLSVTLNENGMLLRFRVVKRTGGTTTLGLTRVGDRRLEIGVDYLNPGEGALIEVLHTDTGTIYADIDGPDIQLEMTRHKAESKPGLWGDTLADVGWAIVLMVFGMNGILDTSQPLWHGIAWLVALSVGLPFLLIRAVREIPRLRMPTEIF